MVNPFQEILKRLERQELELARQAAINDRQGEVISRLEKALISSDRKCKPEVLEKGKNKSLLESPIRYQTSHLQILLQSICSNILLNEERRECLELQMTDMDKDMGSLFGI